MEREIHPRLDPLEVLHGHPEGLGELFLRSTASSTQLRDPTSHVLDEALGIVVRHATKIGDLRAFWTQTSMFVFS
jgi:hypothetical protein